MPVKDQIRLALEAAISKKQAREAANARKAKQARMLAYGRKVNARKR